MRKKYEKLSGRKKAQFMVDIINKFQKLHDKSIVHGDIKPENIMMKNNDFSDLRIVDFGLANYVREDSSAGTSFYVAPERYKHKQLTVEGDIFSLGITFAMMERTF